MEVVVMGAITCFSVPTNKDLKESVDAITKTFTESMQKQQKIIETKSEEIDARMDKQDKEIERLWAFINSKGVSNLDDFPLLLPLLCRPEIASCRRSF